MTSPEPPNADDIPEQFRIRQAKRERLLAEGREPYPIEVARTHTLAEIRQAYPDLEANTGRIVEVVSHAASVLEQFGERLRSGEVLIAGSIVPPLLLEPTDNVIQFSLDPLAPLSVSLRWK